MKDIYIADLATFDEGKFFDGFFIVLAKQQRTTKTNKPYLSLILGDKTGQLEGRIWEPGDPRIAKDFEKGDVVKARGSASRFDDRLQMKVDQLRLAQSGEVDKTDLLPSTTYDIAALWSQLLASVESLSNPDLKRLLHAILDDPAIAAAYREAPAARQLHHAWLGGLLEHVVSLLSLADRVAAHYPLLDRDLLLTGVILHDIGKIRELSWVVGFDYTIEGTLLGHIQMGIDMVEKAIASLPDFPDRAAHAGAAHDSVASRQAGVWFAQAAHDSRGAGAELRGRSGRQDAGCEQRVRQVDSRRQGARRADGQSVVARQPAVAEHEALAGRREVATGQRI